jgi:hypothetical protein
MFAGQQAFNKCQLNYQPVGGVFSNFVDPVAGLGMRDRACFVGGGGGMMRVYLNIFMANNLCHVSLEYFNYLKEVPYCDVGTTACIPIVAIPGEIKLCIVLSRTCG